MRVIDMRCRPPLPANIYGSTLYDIQYANDFARKFGGSCVAESAKQRSLEMLLSEMDEVGIEKAVYEIGYIADWDTNQEAMQLSKQYPDRFLCMASTDIGNIKRSLENIKQYTIEGCFHGVNLDPGSPALGEKSIYINDEKLFPIYELCEKQNIPLTVAFGGYAYPDATAYYVDRVKHVVQMFPKLKLCLCHGGWPYVHQMCSLAMQYRSLYLSPDSYLMEMPQYKDYVLAANSILPMQILFGTSYPFHAQKRVFQFYLTAGFREELYENVFYKNAAEFMNLR